MHDLNPFTDLDHARARDKRAILALLILYVPLATTDRDPRMLPADCPIGNHDVTRLPAAQGQPRAISGGLGEHMPIGGVWSINYKGR
jgi:hypothetical protein